MFRTNKHNKRQLRKSAPWLEITEHTAAFVRRSHLDLSDKRQPHSSILCECIRKGCVPAWTHLPFRLSLSLLHADNKQQTLCKHISSSPSKADVAVWTNQTGRSPSKQGNILLNGFVVVDCGLLLCSYSQQNKSKKVSPRRNTSLE